jgi:ammonium transporter Rh
MIVLYAVFTDYDTDPSALARYPQYQDVHVMIFIGFGFLMCFLHRAGFTATSHAYLVAVLSVMWGILNRGFWARAIGYESWHRPLGLSVYNLINGDFCAGAVLISMGAMIGRISANQLLLMAILEVVGYSINEAILTYRFQVADIGGTMIIHCFGAYFGLFCSWVLGRKADTQKKSSYHNKSSPVTDTMAMVGTLFLFCFWPSFNSALSGMTHPEVQQRATVNTLLSISCSTLAAFMMCRYFYEGKFRMVEVQNATLAGGVAIGASADMIMRPYGAMLIGSAAGMLSVAGYKFVQPFLETRFGLKDTCGVHNLHGMPSVLGAICSVIIARKSDWGNYGATLSDTFAARISPTSGRDAYHQANYQLASLALTLGIAAVCGTITGVIIRLLPTLQYFFVDDIEYEGLEGHGTGGRKIKSLVAKMLKFNATASPDDRIRMHFFHVWIAKAAHRGTVKQFMVRQGSLRAISSPRRKLPTETTPYGDDAEMLETRE